MQSEYGRVYADLYRRHWWWRARESILLRAIARLSLPSPRDTTILDVGCGDGLFFPALRRFGTVRGIEVDQSLLDPANPDRPLIDTEPLGSPIYAGRTYDLITALDVVEHIENDRQAVLDMLSMLKPGGKLLITVPAFMCLWDHHDEINHHFRRYTRQTLTALVPPHGPAQARSIRLREARYLFHSLFVPKLLVRAINRRRQARSGSTPDASTGARQAIDQFKMPPGALNTVAATWCDLEERLVGWLPVPFGTSVLMIVEAAPMAERRAGSHRNPA